MNPKKSIAIVSDHFSIKNGYRAEMDHVSYVRMVSTFSTVAELRTGLKRATFDLVILDMELKSENALELCAQLKNMYKNICILMLSSNHNEELILGAYRNNADGYLFKDSDEKQLALAMLKILVGGEKYFNSECLQVLFKNDQLKPPHVNHEGGMLTARELQIEKMLCEGLSNQQIADLLGRDLTTITTHRQNIMKKTGTHTSNELLHHAIRSGIYIAPSQEE